MAQIQGQDTIADAIAKLSNSLPQVVDILYKLVDHTITDDPMSMGGFRVLLDLDDMNLRGRDIRLAYGLLHEQTLGGEPGLGSKEHLDLFVRVIKDRDVHFVRGMNREETTIREIVTSGGSKP